MATAKKILRVRFEKGLDEARDSEFAEALLGEIRDNWRTTDKAARRLIVGLVVVALLVWLVASSESDQGVQLTLAGVRLDNPSVLLSVSPLIAAFFTLSACEALSNVVMLSSAHDALFAKFHPDAYREDLEQLLWPGDSSVSGSFALRFYGPSKVETVITLISGKYLLLPVGMFALNFYVIWTVLSTHVAFLPIVASVVAAATSVCAIIVFTISVAHDW